MPRYKFDDLVYNITEKATPKPGDEEMYIGLEHMDSNNLSITRWGSAVPLKGQKLCMKKGDILFGKRNTYLRRASIAPHDGLFSAHGMIFRPKTENITKEYLLFFIASDRFMDAAIRISVGSLSPTVNWKTLKELEFEIPELEEQKEKAAILSAMNRTKKAYQNLIIKTDELVKAQFIEMFGDLSRDEKKWPAEKLGNLCKIYRGGSPRPISNFLGGAVPWIKIGDATDGDNIYLKSTREHIIKEGVRKSRMVKAGSLIFANCGVSLGFARIITFDGCIHDGWLSFEDIDDRLDKIFLLKSLNQMTEYFRSMAPTGTQPNLNTKIMSEYLQILPPISLQKEFVQIMKQADQSKSALQQAVEKIDSLMKSLIQQDFSCE